MLEHPERCPLVRDALVKNVGYEAKTELMSEMEVTFDMLSGNFKFACKQMMETCARCTNFVCINDDMKFPSTAVSQILHEHFLFICRKRSCRSTPRTAASILRSITRPRTICSGDSASDRIRLPS
ncbi:hypothetical protein V7S43_017493 [Phytophthora oleae]|uniref:Uncharacterized protein n=1 Tax=Phytophthora oleae TaxID=2107226 RepID=A0ABD3ETN2_9STRA